mmetsp:Transcript_12082/g.19668  ORF Transcript_12082/g.19668 Transcript_12082/m.19668 type:complete len:111 (-) Transcript_12082:1334-1666(-)
MPLITRQQLLLDPTTHCSTSTHCIRQHPLLMTYLGKTYHTTTNIIQCFIQNPTTYYLMSYNSRPRLCIHTLINTITRQQLFLDVSSNPRLTYYKYLMCWRTIARVFASIR